MRVKGPIDEKGRVEYCNLMHRETSAHTAVVWLAHIRFIEKWVVGIHAMDNEKYGNVNSLGVVAQGFD